MAFPLLPATLLLISAGLAALDYFLPPEPLPPVPPTTPIAPPYDPPFQGGQCLTNYRGVLDVRRTANPSQRLVFSWGSGGSGTLIAVGSNPPVSSWGVFAIAGAITDVTTEIVGTVTRVRVNGILVANIPESGNPVVSVAIGGLARSDGLPDNCGNLPDPNPAPPIGGTGLAESPEPDLDGLAEPLTLGLVPVNLAALLAAALAAMQAAETVAALATALADAIKAIKDLIDELKPENRDKNKSTFKFDFGAIEKDGYLKFYGTNNNPNFEAIYLDVLFTDEPIGIGKYFGKFSPNRYIYDRLGYIAFVSPSLGVMEVRELEFYRCSLSVPKDCVGFFYHLGLNGSIKANVSAIYELKLESEPEEE